MRNMISNMANRVTPSLARKLFNMAKEYDDVIDLTLGDPDFNLSKSIKDGIIQALDNNLTHYSANSGLYEARKAVSNHIYKTWGKKCDPNSNIIITAGGMEALFLGLSSIINVGDEVIIFAPYYVNYVQMVKMLMGVPVIIDVYNLDDGVNIDEKELKKHITEKTKAIIINTPNNPTGAIIDKKALKTIAKLSIENDIFIISDEVYRTLVFDNLKHESILQFENIEERVLLVDSMSKEFCATGLRVGYAFGSSEVIENMVKLQENVVACAPVPLQYALTLAYSQNQDNKNNLKEFQKRCDYLYGEICKIPRLKCKKPQGTFYLFVNIEETNMDSQTFAYELLKQKHVAVVPGETYGNSYKNYIRIAFTKNIDILRVAIDRLKEFIASNF